MDTFLVTGGGGFIGSNLVEALLREGHDVRALDDFSSGRRENLAAAERWATAGSGRFALLEGDICDAQTCRDAVRGARFVLHQAAVPSVQRSIQDPARTNEVNVRGTLNLLLAAREAKVERFVFASSSSIYGDSASLPKRESQPPDPISPYALQKYAGETYCRLFQRLYTLPTVALRYFNVFGPRQDPHSEYSAVIPLFLSAARANRPATIFGDGEQSRDFTYIDNVVQANLRACRAEPSACGRAYNVACGEHVSLNGLLDRVAELVGQPVARQHRDPRPGDVRHSLADIAEATSRLGYRPQVGWVEGLGRTLAAL